MPLTPVGFTSMLQSKGGKEMANEKREDEMKRKKKGEDKRVRTTPSQLL